MKSANGDTLLNQRMNQWRKVGLYPVITPEFCSGRDPVDVLKAILSGGAKAVQLRIKEGNDSDHLKLAFRFRQVTEESGALLIIDDRVDIALIVGADGVHLGQDDLPLREARKIAPELILGASSHNLQEALQAQKDGADYVNVGPIYGTATKILPIKPLGLPLLKEIIPHLKIPFTVMGGIKLHNIPELTQLGVRTIALVTAVTQADDITNAVKSLSTSISAGH